MPILKIDQSNFLQGMSLSDYSGDKGFSPLSKGFEVDRHQATITVSKASGDTPLFLFESTGATAANVVPYRISGAAIINATTNITSFSFIVANGGTYDGEIWILKPNKS